MVKNVTHYVLYYRFHKVLLRDFQITPFYYLSRCFIAICFYEVAIDIKTLILTQKGTDFSLF